jgi:hypothetical protein
MRGSTRSRFWGITIEPDPPPLVAGFLGAQPGRPAPQGIAGRSAGPVAY